MSSSIWPWHGRSSCKLGHATSLLSQLQLVTDCQNRQLPYLTGLIEGVRSRKPMLIGEIDTDLQSFRSQSKSQAATLEVRWKTIGSDEREGVGTGD